jgi:hypothetical protein
VTGPNPINEFFSGDAAAARLSLLHCCPRDLRLHCYIAAGTAVAAVKLLTAPALALIYLVDSLLNFDNVAFGGEMELFGGGRGMVLGEALWTAQRRNN